MSTVCIEAAPKTNKSVKPPRKTAKSKAKPTSSATKVTSDATKEKASAKVLASVVTPAVPTKSNASSTTARSTKQDRVLALLSRPDGANLTEMMQATEWQQHSVRGFLAGTVKKKLSLTLISTKAAGEERRYRIETKRSR